MEKELDFWLGLWRTVALAFVIVVVGLMIYNNEQNKLWYESWNKCVIVGGQPLEDTVKGSDSRTFTCVKP